MTLNSQSPGSASEVQVSSKPGVACSYPILLLVAAICSVPRVWGFGLHFFYELVKMSGKLPTQTPFITIMVQTMALSLVPAVPPFQWLTGPAKCFRTPHKSYNLT